MNLITPPMPRTFYALLLALAAACCFADEAPLHGPIRGRDAIYKQLWSDLSRRDAADRTAIVDILRDTKPGLPAYFRPTR
jgi:hypothetical protein